MVSPFPVRISAVNAEYVRIMTSAADGFDTLLFEQIPRSVAELALKLKPYLFIVSNPSSRTVLAYCVRFDFTRKDGGRQTTLSQFKDPMAALTGVPVVSGQYEVLVPGRHRVISISMVFNSEERFNILDWIPTYKSYIEEECPPDKMKGLAIEADAVILDDGALTGPDHSNLAADFSSAVAADRDVFREVVDHVDAGGSLQQIFDALGERNRKLFQEHPEAAPRLNSVGDALRVWKRQGDAEFLRTARAALASKEFAVRRRE